MLELEDDGAGIDLERLRARVLERQLASAETAVPLSWNVPSEIDHW